MIDSRSTNRAMISVIEKARGRQERHGGIRLMSVALMVVFFVALMGSLAAGASMYRSTVEAQEEANDLHLQSGLITNVIRYNDVAAALREVDGPEGPALVLARTLASGTYETRIYHYQGQVLQELAAAGRPFDPKGATPLMRTEQFSFEVHDGLLTFTTDCGSFDVALRADPGDGTQATTAPDAPATPNIVTIVDEGGM